MVFLVAAGGGLAAILLATWLLRRYAPGLARPAGRVAAALAIAAALALTTTMLVGQTLSDSTCTRDRVTLAIGTGTVTLDIETGARIYAEAVPGSARLYDEWSGTFYGLSARAKSGVRALCKAEAEGGGAVPDVDDVVFAITQDDLPTLCAKRSDPADPACQPETAAALAHVSSLRLEDDTDYGQDPDRIGTTSVSCRPWSGGAARCDVLMVTTDSIRLTTTTDPAGFPGAEARAEATARTVAALIGLSLP